MKEARLTRPALAKKMHVTVSLVDKWKSISQDEKQHRRPTYDQVVELVKIFAPQLNPQAAQQWAHHAGYQLSESDLRAILSSINLPTPPSPISATTLSRLESIPIHPLFGVDTAKTKMLDALNQEDDYWLLALSGIGGIGKTSLAHDLVRGILPTQRFHDVAWISAKQELFLPDKGLQPTQHPALDPLSLIDSLLEQLDPMQSTAHPPQEKQAILMHWFKKYPYLVVIDNLETIRDYEVLLAPLRKLANPTKFLVTSRHSLSQYSDVFSHSLTELTQTDTLLFLRYLAKMQHISVLSDAPDTELKKIYEVTGGNPLALKLVVGQIHFSNLPDVLAGLEQAKGKKADELFRFIYRHIWDTLTEPTRRVLLMTPLAPDGTRQDLQRLSHVSDDELNQALEQLINRSLIEFSGDLRQRRYYIHSLTKLFLHTEIFNRWKRD